MLSFFRQQKENDINTEQAAPETAGQVIISNDSDLQSVLGVTRCKLQADLLELQLGGAGSVDSLRNILTSVTKQVDIIFSSVEKERELRISLQEQLQKNLAETCRSLSEATYSTLKRDMQMELAEILQLLKSDGAGSLKDLSGIMAEVSKQVDEFRNATAKERELRHVLEAKMNKRFNEQESKLLGQQRDMKSLVNDFANLKVELAEQRSTWDQDIALKKELQQSQLMLRDELVSHAKCTQDALKSMMNQHYENSSKILTDVTQQVQNLQQSASTEHVLRVAVEAKVDKIFSEQHKMILDLRQDMQTAVSESNAALKSDPNPEWPGLPDPPQSLLPAEREQKTQEGKAEEGLQNFLASIHVELQEALRLLRSGGASSLKNLGQQVSTLERSVEFLQNQMRLVVGVQMDKMLPKDKNVEELKKDMRGAQRSESPTALRPQRSESPTGLRRSLAKQVETRAGGEKKQVADVLLKSRDDKEMQRRIVNNNNMIRLVQPASVGSGFDSPLGMLPPHQAQLLSEGGMIATRVRVQPPGRVDAQRETLSPMGRTRATTPPLVGTRSPMVRTRVTTPTPPAVGHERVGLRSTTPPAVGARTPVGGQPSVTMSPLMNSRTLAAANSTPALSPTFRNAESQNTNGGEQQHLQKNAGHSLTVPAPTLRSSSVSKSTPIGEQYQQNASNSVPTPSAPSPAIRLTETKV
mmetsp:Transcript_88465/g.166760  ORF Transcript_88465/g.166760 Transcript_88465/m.166760 type:complete len:697 (+) Transcript_88465:33-2123(+)